MTHKTALTVLLAGFTLAAASTATAQTRDMKLFVDVNGGAQTQARTLSTSTSFPLYGETAIVNASEAVDSGGFFDISGGYRLMPDISVGVGVSVFSASGDGTLAASIPDPNFRNQPAVSTTTASNLKHNERSVYVTVAYRIPLKLSMLKKTEASIFAGPSFFTAKQDIVSATVATGTKTATVATTNEKASKTGAIAGVSLNYMVTPNYGGGLFVRYNGATVKLPSAGDVKVGGVQVGVGARLRF